MFLVLTKYEKSMDEIERLLPSHSEHLQNYYNQKKLIVSGRLNPRTGGFMLFNVTTKEELEAILDKDPFKINGCLSYQIIEMVPTKYDERFKPFL